LLFLSPKILGFLRSRKHKIEYPYILSAMKPVPHGVDPPTSAPPTNWKVLSLLSEEEEGCMEGPSSYVIQNSKKGIFVGPQIRKLA
jgi:hypothetical protein